MGLECIIVYGLMVLSSQQVTRAYQHHKMVLWRDSSMHRGHLNKERMSSKHLYRWSTGFSSRLQDSADRRSDLQSRDRSMPRVGEVVIAQVDAFSEGAQDSTADSQYYSRC